MANVFISSQQKQLNPNNFRIKLYLACVLREYLHTLSKKFEYERGKPTSPISNNECLGIYVSKIIRDNWEYLGKKIKHKDTVYSFEKKINNHLRIEKKLHSTSSPPKEKGCYFEEHFIHGVLSGRSDFNNIEYLDYYNGNIFWPEDGKLVTSSIIGNVIQAPKTIQDFSEYKYCRIKAPY